MNQGTDSDPGCLPGDSRKPRHGTPSPARSFLSRHRLVSLVVMATVVYVFTDLCMGLAVIPRSYDAFRTPHPYYHHGFLPMQSDIDSFCGLQYPIFTNSLGLRDRGAFKIDVEDGHERMLILGDSFIEGQGVGFEQSVAGLLQSFYAPDGVEVLNAAVSSYSPRLYLLKARWLVEQAGLRFDRLVVFVDISDIANEIAYQYFEPGAFGRGELARFRIAKWLRKRSATVYSVDRVSTGGVHNPLLNPVFRSSLEPMSEQELEVVHSFFDYEYVAAWVRDDAALEAWGRHGLELAEDHMSQLVQLCDDLDARMSLVVFPWPNQLFWGDRDSRQLRYWRDFAARKGIGFVDLYPAFFSAGPPDRVHKSLFIHHDVHWNEHGNRLVASHLLAHLLQNE